MKKKGDPNGRLTLTNVVAQSYTAQVSAVGYENSSKAITVNDNQQVNITLSRASCTITFNITNGANALVQLSDGSTVNLNSSGGGSVSKPCGEYSYTISKEGHSALSGGIEALSNVTIQGIMAKSSGDAVIGGGDVVEIAVVYTRRPEYFTNVFKDRHDRAVVVRPRSSELDQITLSSIVSSAFDYASDFRPITMQVVAIGAGGDHAASNSWWGGGSGYYNWAKFTTLPDAHETLTVSVSVGNTVSTGNGQPSTVSIPQYGLTITASGGCAGNSSGACGLNPGSSVGAGASGRGFGSTSTYYLNGSSSKYIYEESLPIWRELANTPVVANGVGGGGFAPGSGTYYEPEPGAVFILIRGVVYY